MKPTPKPSNLSLPATEQDIELLFQALLKRPFGDDAERRRWASHERKLIDYVNEIRGSIELRALFKSEMGVAPPSTAPTAADIDDYRYRIPDALRRSPRPPRNVLVIGSCMTEGWATRLATFDSAPTVERITFNNASILPHRSIDNIRSFDFQIVQIPVRSVMPEGLFFSLKLDDVAGWEQAFSTALNFLKLNFDAALAYHRAAGLRTYLLNFAVPQQNPAGRLMPRYALNNLVFFVEELNKALYGLAAALNDVHVIDFDQIAAGFGRKYVQDDMVQHTNHGGVLCDFWRDIDHQRLEQPGNIERLYRPRVIDVVKTIYEEILAAEASLQQTDAIKLVIFDLDDTLWRGILAEADSVDPTAGEGWPLGLVEAAANLWRRGILIAIVSKNDDERTRAAWQRLYGSRFGIDKFVSVKIGWGPKPESIAQILAEVNLLPQNVLFVDDNPVERAGVRAAFPEIRTIEAPLAEWRRILLWSPELQTGSLSAESLKRTEMIQAQIERSATAQTMDRSEFLASLDLHVDMRRIAAPDEPGFERCLELLNKTNQFNTTGQRWTQLELATLLSEGGYILSVEARDRFTQYGIIGVAVIAGERIVQIVLSCRVFGMEIEHAMVGCATGMIAAERSTEVRARIVPTGRNELALGLYRAAGFTEEAEGEWRGPAVREWKPPAHMKANLPG